MATNYCGDCEFFDKGPYSAGECHGSPPVGEWVQSAYLEEESKRRVWIWPTVYEDDPACRIFKEQKCPQKS